jgi:hypothetical protein
MCHQPHHRLGGAPVLPSLAAGPRRIARVVGRAHGARLRRRPQPKEWSVVEVLAHLLDAEITLGFRVRSVAAQPGGPLVAWDQDKWAAGLHHRRADPKATLAAFTSLRANTVALLRRLSPRQRRAAGRHPEYGPLRIDQILHHWAEHDLIHLEQIESTLATLARR